MRLGEFEIGGEDQAAFLVGVGNDLEQQPSASGIAEFGYLPTTWTHVTEKRYASLGFEKSVTERIERDPEDR